MSVCFVWCVSFVKFILHSNFGFYVDLMYQYTKLYCLMSKLMMVTLRVHCEPLNSSQP